MAKSHTFILTYAREDGDEDVYEFTAYSYEQAALFADMYCRNNKVVFVDLELSCMKARGVV